MIDQNKSKFAVLFVDDEEKARKMFKRLVSPQYEVFTASDVKEAMELLEKEADQIGVLITDQRMPGLLGVDLLRHVRKEYPDIIRLLTTAYSDLSDAIEAVNTGEIFRYINKPWNVDELLIDLQLAMSFFVLQKDRTQLIQEKLSVLQHQTTNNTLKTLISLSSAQVQYKQPLAATKSFLQQLAEPKENIDDKALMNNADYWTQEVQQSQKMIGISRSLSLFLNDKTSLLNNSEENPENTDWNISIDNASKNSTQHILSELNADITQPHFNQIALNRMISGMTDAFGSGDITIKVSKESNPDQDSIRISTRTSSPDSAFIEQFMTATNDDAIKKIANLLGVFILSYSVGGNVKLDFDKSKLNSIEINLPQASKMENLKDIEGTLWMEDLFVLYS